MSKDTEEFSKKEAQARFEAALRGARITGHKPMSELKVGRSAKRNLGKVAKQTKAKK